MIIGENNNKKKKSVLANTMNQYCTSITKTTESKKISRIKEFRRHH